uniref:CSON000284 protein n=1 Tax=Culicoides sonorensis TaxID=179676 RepID=A0A336MFA6_CULSO
MNFRYFADGLLEILLDLNTIDDAFTETQELEQLEHNLNKAKTLEIELARFFNSGVDQNNAHIQVDWMSLHGFAHLLIYHIGYHNNLDETLYLNQLIERIEFISQMREGVWLFTYAMYYKAKCCLNNGNDMERALNKLVTAHQNIIEFQSNCGNANVEVPHEILEILQINGNNSLNDTIFLSFEELHVKIQADILRLAYQLQNEEALYKYGMQGIQATLKFMHNTPISHQIKILFDKVEYLTETYIDHLCFRQARFLISLNKSLLERFETEDKDEQEDLMEIHYHINLIVMTVRYIDGFLKAVMDYRLTLPSQFPVPDPLGLYEACDDSDDFEMCEILLPWNIKTVTDTEIVTLIKDARTYLKEIKESEVDDQEMNDSDNVSVNSTDFPEIAKRLDQYEKTLITDSGDENSNARNTFLIGTKIMQLRYRLQYVTSNNFYGLNENQKFTCLVNLCDEFRELLNNLEEDHLMYDEVSKLTCAMDVIFVEEFNRTAHYKSKVKLVLQRCESISETFRLLPSGMILYVTSIYFQAKNVLKNDASPPEHIKEAVKLLELAHWLFEEYNSNNPGVPPKDLSQIIGFKDPTGTLIELRQSTKPGILQHLIKYELAKSIIKLHDFDLMEKYSIEGLKSALLLYEMDQIQFFPFMKILLAFSYEFLEVDHMSQANHLISVITILLESRLKILTWKFTELIKEIDTFNLCYIHTLICKSIFLINQRNEHEHEQIFKQGNVKPCKRILESHLVLLQEIVFPTSATANRHDIRLLFEKSQDLIKKLTKDVHYNENVSIDVQKRNTSSSDQAGKIKLRF